MIKPALISILLFIAMIFIVACKHDRVFEEATNGYPQDVANIILNKCAVSGCHNNSSSINAAGLNLTTWNNMFHGSALGAVVIPGRSDFSTLCYFTNIDSSFGLILSPTMPIGMPSLSNSEYFIITNWIKNGAPDINGKLRFADSPGRKKLFVTNRLCNVVTVFDESSFLQMSYVNVGNNTSARYPYCVKGSPDKQNWYVSFFTQTNIVQKFNANNDNLITDLDIGSGQWYSFVITQDSQYGFFADNSSPGKIAYVDLQNNIVIATYSFGGNFKYLSGIALNEALKKLYVGTSTGNFVYAIDITDPLSPIIKELPIDGTGVAQYSSSLNPTELITDISSNKCFIACSYSNEIRVLNMSTDSLVATIPLGASPAYMSYSRSKNELFISCPDDMLSFPGNRGSVMIADLQTSTIAKKINSGYQPYGISVDEDQGIVSVVNANISGPASHHTSGCGKKLGYVSFIDLNSKELVYGKTREIAVFPYSIATR